MSFKESYLGKLREIVGSKPILIPGARVFVLNDQEELLYIKRTDFGIWGFIGGSSEYGESIIETAQRESSEEAGIDVKNLELVGVSTTLADEEVCYPNGDIIHAYSIMFWTKEYLGIPTADNIEASEVKFFPLERPPENMHPNSKRALEKFQKFYQSKEIIIS